MPKHEERHRKLERARKLFETSPLNHYDGPPQPELLIISAGCCWSYIAETLELLDLSDRVGVLKLGTTWPLPQKVLKEHITSSPSVLFVEEVDPFLEEAVKAFIADLGDQIGTRKFMGKSSGHIPQTGELSPALLLKVLGNYFGITWEATLYREKVAPDLQKEYAYTSPMQIPRLSKVSVSVGVGEAIQNKKLLDSAMKEIEMITGQRPVRTKARKSISNFKLREGMEIGAKVTLRGAYMWEFLDRFMNIALARVKDFRGVNPNSFDGHGNFSIGITEQIIFPEIDYDTIERVSGLNVAIVTTAETDQEARSLLTRLGMPFRK